MKSIKSIVLPLVASALLAGCGVAPVKHTPKLAPIAGAKMPDLHGTGPVEVKNAATDSGEVKIGTAGVGKIMGNLSEWTEVAVKAIQDNLKSRGATITPGASKSFSVAMTKAHASGMPMTGVTTTRITLTVTGGFQGSFEGSSSSMAPLASVDGAVKDAVTKLLLDPALESYVHQK